MTIYDFFEAPDPESTVIFDQNVDPMDAGKDAKMSSEGPDEFINFSRGTKNTKLLTMGQE